MIIIGIGVDKQVKPDFVPKGRGLGITFLKEFIIRMIWSFPWYVSHPMLLVIFCLL